MNLLSHVDLKPYNTFGIQAFSQQFAIFHNEAELQQLLEDSSVRADFVILGGGSNILLCRDLAGTVLKNEIYQWQVEEVQDQVLLTVGSGNVWSDVVQRTVELGYYGLENMALIPGTVGAAPMQNIGAYGSEIKDVLYQVRGFDLRSNSFRQLASDECHFDYRSSIFKTTLKNQFIITAVTLELSKRKKINTSYKALSDYFRDHGVVDPTQREVFEAVCAIRQSKLPDPTLIGNAGSFFKNPVIDLLLWKNITQSYPEAPFFKIGDDRYKIPAAWLIEKIGYKGLIKTGSNGGRYGVHKNQPLVLVNYGGAEGCDLLNLAEEIRHKILSQFQIKLEFEVNIL